MITYLIHAKENDLQLFCNGFEIKDDLIYFWVTNNTECGIIRLSDVYYVGIVEPECEKCFGNGAIESLIGEEMQLVNCPECGGIGIKTQ